jgi:hypothetical protein
MDLSFRLLVALPLAIVALNARLILLAIKAARTSDVRDRPASFTTTK